MTDLEQTRELLNRFNISYNVDNGGGPNKDWQTITLENHVKEDIPMFGYFQHASMWAFGPEGNFLGMGSYNYS